MIMHIRCQLGGHAIFNYVDYCKFTSAELLVSISCEVVVGRAEPRALFDVVIFWEKCYKIV